MDIVPLLDGFLKRSKMTMKMTMMNDHDDNDNGEGSGGVGDGRCLNLILRTKKSPSQPSW